MTTPFDPDNYNVSHHFVNGEVYSKRIEIPAGTVLTQHSHPYAHASALVSGKCLLDDGCNMIQLHGPAMVMIDAHKRHSVTAITPCVWHCIHVTSDTDPETVDETILSGE